MTERRYLTVAYLVDLWRTRTAVTAWNGEAPADPVTFVGIEAPENLPAGSQACTLDGLSELIPA